MKIYKQHNSRVVREAPGFTTEILNSIRPLSDVCKEGVFTLEEEWETNDPDVDERCGLLAVRHEIYSVRIPGCRGYRIAVSMDLGSKPPPITIHGAIRSKGACMLAQKIATRHLKLINPSWE